MRLVICDNYVKNPNYGLHEKQQAALNVVFKAFLDCQILAIFYQAKKYLGFT